MAPTEGCGIVAHARSQNRLRPQFGDMSVSEWSFGDLQEGNLTWPSGRSIETTVHLASPSSWSLLEDPRVYDIILDSVKGVFEHSLSLGVKHFIYVSSAAALGGYSCKRDWLSRQRHWLPSRERFPYAAAKADAETWLVDRCEEAGVTFSVVYPGEVYGADDEQMVTAGSIREMITSKLCLVSRGGTRVADRDSVASTLWDIVKKQTSVRAILAGDFLEFKDIAKIARRRAGVNGPVLEMPNSLVNAAIELRRRVGLDLVGHPDAAARYGQVYWLPSENEVFPEFEFRCAAASVAVEQVTDWLLKSNSQ